jgi:hypothetical protein
MFSAWPWSLPYSPSMTKAFVLIRPHLFIDVLAKVDYVKNATTVVQVRINQVFSEAFEQGQGDLSLVHVHDSSTANSIFDSGMVLFLKNLNLCNFEHLGSGCL